MVAFTEDEKEITEKLNKAIKLINKAADVAIGFGTVCIRCTVALNALEAAKQEIGAITFDRRQKGDHQ